MVHSVIISNLNCEILYSADFDFNQTLNSENLSYIVRKVMVEFDFNFAVSNSYNFSDITSMTGNPFKDFETKGVINIKIGDNYKSVVYHSFCGCIYIFVCDYSDNRLLAYRTLVLLIRTLRDIIPKMTSYTSEIVSNADVVSMVINTFVPSGQLLFLHDQAVQQVSKDLQKILR